MTAANRGGAGKCVTCAHAQLVAIDADLVAEVPYRQLAKRYGISTRSLLRHKNAHLGREVVALERGVVVPAGESGVARMEALYVGLYDRWVAAIEAKQTGMLLQLSRELRPVIELKAKLTGELDEKPQNLTVNLLANDQFMEAIKAIIETLAPYPEARQALVGRLRVLNGEK